MDANYFYCKCSICFVNDSEMEFINCGDQYCLSCLERYVEYWIKEGSWGLQPAELSCPVCGTEMLDDDWMPYISTKTMELWNKFELKRKEIIRKQVEIKRACPICNNLQSLIGSTKQDTISDLILIGDCLMRNLDSTSFESWRSIFGLENVLMLFKEEVGETDLDFIENCQDLFNEFLNLIEKLKIFGFFKSEEEDLMRLLMEFGRTFLNLIYEKINSEDPDAEGIAEMAFIDMQLNFQSIFPFGHCDSCNLDFCLPCQIPAWFHQNHQKTSLNIRPDGSKQCPRCFVMIEKDPDGCNEMKCNYCGMKFCWECGRKWSKECGIYKCNQNTVSSEEEDIPRSEIKIFYDSSERDPEIGVPNVQMIHNRIR